MQNLGHKSPREEINWTT